MTKLFLNAFQLWSLFHLLFFLAPFFMALLLYVFLKKKPESTKRKVGVILAIITVIDLLLRNIEIFVVHNFQIQPDIIPLQVCHLATFILLAAFLYKSNTMFAIAFCFNFPLALLSIVFAGGLAIMPTLFSFKAMAYLVGHIMIVGLTIWALFSGLFQIDWKAQKQSMIIIFLSFLFMIVINQVNQRLMPDYVSNYFFTSLPEPNTPLVWFYEWGKETVFLGLKVNWVYLFFTMLFGFAIYFLSLYLYRFFVRYIKPKLDI